MHTAAPLRHRIQGYLLIEALVALLIAAGTLATLIALQLDLQREARLAAERGFAARWAEQGGEAWLGHIRAGADPAESGADGSDDLFRPMTDVTDPVPATPGYWMRRSSAPGSPITAIEILVEWPHPGADPARRLRWHGVAALAGAAESVRASVAGDPVISP
jgi:hypothetical protein